MSDKTKIYNYIKRTINPYGRPFEGTVYEFGVKIMDFIENIDGEKEAGWIPASNMPNCCGYPVLLTVENKFGQRRVCKAFTNYMKAGKQLFYTNEKEYCAELTSSKLSEAWKPIAWMELPEPYKED